MGDDLERLAKLGKTLEQIPVVGEFTFELINYRIGFMTDEETGEKVGLIFEFWMVPIPWMKFHIPFRMPYLDAFMRDLNDKYSEITEET